MSSLYYKFCNSRILKHIKADNIKDENIILRDEYNVNSIIFKIRIK